MDILSCRDRWGRTIFLPQTNWDDKILLDHPELIGNEESVRQTLTDPDLVAHDVDYPDRSRSTAAECCCRPTTRTS